MAKDYSKLSPEELLKMIEHLEARKKYGLVWEVKPEDVAVQCATELPVLAEVPKRKIAADEKEPTHILIEGDNYHALSVLSYTHQGRIDVIYIDPPYNTGAKDWKYNNDFVDANDTYRHSKWLSMMEKRLVLAKRLLKEDGVLIVAIDDNEVHRLRLLIEEVMPGYDVTSVTVVHNPRGNITNNFARTHEYALFVIPKGQSVISRTMRENASPRKMRRWGHNSTRTARPTMFYPIYVKSGKVVRVGAVPEKIFHPKARSIDKKNGEVEIWPIDQHGIERRWNFGLDSIGGELERIVAIKSKGEWDLFLTQEDTTTKTVWTETDLEAGRHGATLVKAITGTSFPYPKSIHAVRKCIGLVIDGRPDAIVLDFFAGSGTTGHAVMQINAEVPGNRSFIMCTNNESNICEEVTYPRLKGVIRGYGAGKNKVPGLGGGLKYFRTAFVKKSASKDELKIKVTNACTEMLCLREGVYDEVSTSSPDYRIFKRGNRVLAVYYSLLRDKLDELRGILDSLGGDRVLYCFTLDPLGLNRNDFDEWSGVRLEPIPQKILDVYEEIHGNNA